MTHETVSIRLTGVAPLLMRSGRLADPLDEQTIALERFTRKRVRTKADHEAIARIEWAAGMWMSGGRPCIPNFAVEACLVQAAKKRRAGAAARAGLIVEHHSPLVYEGPSDLDDLWRDARFALRALVQVQGRKVVRTRARFPDWTAEVAVSYLPHIVDLQQLLDDLVVAGDQIGLGDWRPRFGRFRGELSR